MNVEQTIQVWKDHPDTHAFINDSFKGLVNATPELKDYRDWIEQNIFGFGERSFIWMWKILIDEMPANFNFLEIGVFRGQVLGAVRLISDMANKNAGIIGVTPLDSTGGHWESDYEQDIKTLFDTFKLAPPRIIKGLSTDPETIKSVPNIDYDMVYIDGGHSYDVVKSDLTHYPPMVKVGGYLIIDDCANRYNLPPGYFRGIDTVSKAVDEVLPNEHFKELFSVVHNRVFKRIK